MTLELQLDLRQPDPVLKNVCLILRTSNMKMYAAMVVFLLRMSEDRVLGS